MFTILKMDRPSHHQRFDTIKKKLHRQSNFKFFCFDVWVFWSFGKAYAFMRKQNTKNSKSTEFSSGAAIRSFHPTI